MNMPVLPVTSPSQPPTESPARASDATASGRTPSFSNVLSQQQGHPASGQKSATPPRASGEQPPDEKTHDPVDPDSTLNLILDSTALPIMQAQASTGLIPGTGTGQPTDAATTASADPATIGAPTAPTSAVLLASLVAAAQQPSGTQTASSAGLQPQAGASHSRASDASLMPTTASAVPDATAAGGDHGSQPSLAQIMAASAAQRSEGDGAPRLDTSLAPPATTSSTQDATSVSAQNTVDAQAALFGAQVTGPNPPSTQAMQAAAPVITLAVPTPLASAQWAQDLGRQLAALAQSGPNGTHLVQLHVNPPELGPVHITLQIGDALTQASFVSPHAHVRQTLENALPRLEQQFAQAGLSLGQANVSDQQAGQQGFAQSFTAPQHPSGTTFNLETRATGVAPLAIHTTNPARHPDALVDTFA